MARTLNKVILIGRLGADPDVRYTQSGLAVVRFNLATNEWVSVGEGQREERTEWHRVVVFGKTAENCANYLSKGRLVYVEGRLRTNQWDDSQGIKRFTTEIVASDVGFLDSSRDALAQVEANQAPPRREPRPKEPLPNDLPEIPAMPGSSEDDIPF